MMPTREEIEAGLAASSDRPFHGVYQSYLALVHINAFEDALAEGDLMACVVHLHNAQGAVNSAKWFSMGLPCEHSADIIVAKARERFGNILHSA